MTCTRIENFDVRCLVILASVRPQLSLNINFEFSVPAPNSRHRGDNCPQPLWMKWMHSSLDICWEWKLGIWASQKQPENG
eukprot:g11256.t1